MSLYNAGDQVFAKHESHSWILAKISKVTPIKEANLAPGRKSKSAWIYDCVAADSSRGVEKDEMKLLDETDVEMCNDQMKDEQVDDLLKLTQLHDSTLLRCLFIRYMKDIVYTNIGAIVVALNPFNFKIPHYMEDQIDKYLKESGGYISERLLPHSWAQAHNTFYDLCSSESNQCILVSGESGAGKTEATKIVIRYLARVSALSATPEVQEQAMDVLKNLVACSPLLESFGNARTVRNDNSSRFGKLMKIKFDETTRAVRGAFTTKYLLEKSRIVTCSQNERVYHAFYLTAIGKDAKPKYLYKKEPKAYTSLFAGSTLENSEFGKPEDYVEVCDCMKTLGISAADTECVWRLAASVVHGSCINFDKDGEGSVVQPGDGGEDHLNACCQLWGIANVDSIKKEFLTTTLLIMGKPTVKVLAPVKAVDARDAFSKSIYDTLFSLLVDKCNVRCDVPGEGRWIALLDIFGFEDFEHNSFEQLCINLANETLQNHYNDYIFRKDMDECRAEGISVVNITCPDNSPCLNMISDGILVALDDECSMGSGTDQGFFDKIVDKFNEKHPFFSKKKTAKDNFIVHHYAGEVSYNVKNWLEKNRDTIKEPLKEAMRSSSLPFCAQLFPATESTAKPITVGTFFKNQLKDLMAVINSTNPHWIRCVKPHPAKKPRHFNGLYTMLQLESSGVLGTVKIRKAGYPVRWKHIRFALRYQPIAPLDVLIMEDARALTQHCKLILQRTEFLEEKYAQVGKTIVFMKAEVYPLMEKKRLQALQSTTRILQKAGRGMMRRIKLFQTKHIMVIQKAGRGMLGRMLAYDIFEDKNRAKIQEMRKAREEQRRREEEEMKKFQAAAREILMSEANLRKQLTDAMAQFWQAFWASESEDRRETEAFTRKREEEQKRKIEEEIRRKQMEAFLESIKGLIKPLFGDEEQGRASILKQEADFFRTSLYEERMTRIQLAFEVGVRDLSRNEAKARAMIQADQFDDSTEVLDAYDQLKELRRIYDTAAQLNQALSFSRQARKEREEARKELLENKQRSRVELLLYEGNDGVYATSTTKNQNQNHLLNDGSASEFSVGRQSSATTNNNSSYSPTRAAPQNGKLETRNDELMKKLKQITDMDRAAPIAARASALDFNTSRSNGGGTNNNNNQSRSINPPSSSSASTEQQNNLEKIQNLRNRLDPLKKRPLNNVEVGQRVYSHRDFCHGEVVAKRPGATNKSNNNAKNILQQSTSSSFTFQVKLDNGLWVWLELDDVSEATGSHAYSTTSASLPSSSSRTKSPSASTMAPRHRDPTTTTSAPSIQRLLASEADQRDHFAKSRSPVRTNNNNSNADNNATAGKYYYDRVAPTKPLDKTSGTDQGKSYFSNWQSRMSALEGDDW